MSNCKNAVETQKTDTGEVLVLCAITDKWESVTHGECLGNCVIEEEPMKRRGRRKSNGKVDFENE